MSTYEIIFSFASETSVYEKNDTKSRPYLDQITENWKRSCMVSAFPKKEPDTPSKPADYPVVQYSTDVGIEEHEKHSVKPGDVIIFLISIWFWK